MHPNTKNSKQKRPPVIVVMGHIDHGKSTLLDYIRKANTVAKETGGITQHVGAYEAVYTDKTGAEHKLTFLDTPGHEAFCSIREHGAKAADLAILVVSGEDGVKPQTLEALKCIRNSKTPFVIAISKIDRPNADIERVKGNLAEHEIYVEGYGGDIPCVGISAVSGAGIHELLDILILMADMEDLSGDPSKKAQGIVIEAHVDQKKGTTATLIIKDGTLLVGNVVVSGDSYSPVRAIENYAGKHTKEARFGSPVLIVGWTKVPAIGAPFFVVSSRKEAEESVAKNQRPVAPQKTPDVTISNPDTHAVILIVIKADTVGSLEAVKHEIEKINVDGVSFKILLQSVGSINENDVKTAMAAVSPLIVGFNIKADASAKALAERAGLSIMLFDIIYRLTEWLAEECTKRKPRVEVEQETGRAKVLKLFSSEKGRQVIGARVESGVLQNGNAIKIMRRDVEIARGKIKNLQQQKVKVEEVGKDKEFGAMIESKIEPAPGDRLEAFTIVVQ